MWFSDRLTSSRPLLVQGAYDALSAMTMQQAGAESVYLGSYAVAAASFGKPDIGFASFAEVIDVARRIRGATTVPLVVDIDTGYGGPVNVLRSVRAFAELGVAAVQIEDQINPKRCGHFSGKMVVSRRDALARVEAAIEGASGSGTAVIARTDSLAPEGIEEAIWRATAFAAAGATATFVDAMLTVDQIREVRQRVPGPMVFNAADTGYTPKMTTSMAAELGIAVVLMPVQALFSAWRSVQSTAVRMVRMADDETFQNTGGADFRELNGFLGFGEIEAWEGTLGLLDTQ